MLPRCHEEGIHAGSGSCENTRMLVVAISGVCGDAVERDRSVVTDVDGVPVFG